MSETGGLASAFAWLPSIRGRTLGRNELEVRLLEVVIS